MFSRPRQRREFAVNGIIGCGLAGPSAVLNGSDGGPPNGALIMTTERNTSGRISAHHAATDEPKSCPITASTLR